jgi:hypothetical protein
MADNPWAGLNEPRIAASETPIPEAEKQNFPFKGVVPESGPEGGRAVDTVDRTTNDLLLNIESLLKTVVYHLSIITNESQENI